MFDQQTLLLTGFKRVAAFNETHALSYNQAELRYSHFARFPIPITRKDTMSLAFVYQLSKNAGDI
jgi:hypothetical protein